jgi:hypothetical protein
MSSVTLSGALPADDRNGIGAIATALIDQPKAVHVVVALVSCSKITTKPRSGETVPTVEILAVEAFTAATADAKELERLLRRQHERRTGKVELPLELEKALDEITLTDDTAEDTTADGAEG